MRSRSILPLAVLLVAACAADVSEPQFSALPEPCASPAPLYGSPDARIPDRFIVVFHDDTDAKEAAIDLGERFGFAPTSIWEHTLLGFAARMSASAVAGVRCDPRVALVEYNQIVRLGI